MQAIGHKGHEDAATDRQGVTDAFTSPQAGEAIGREESDSSVTAMC